MCYLRMEANTREHVWSMLAWCNKACVYEGYTKSCVMPVSHSLLTFEECTHVPNIFLFPHFKFLLDGSIHTVSIHLSGYDQGAVETNLFCARKKTQGELIKQRYEIRLKKHGFYYFHIHKGIKIKSIKHL